MKRARLGRASALLLTKPVLFQDGFGGSQIAPWWQVTDLESKISVSGGNLVFSGGKATPNWTDPALVSKAPYVWARVPGLTIEWQVTPGATDKFSQLGFTDGTLVLGTEEAHAFYFLSSSMVAITWQGALNVTTPLAYSTTPIWCRIVLKSTGAHYYVSSDNRATWTLIWTDSTVTTTPLYAFIESYNAALTTGGVQVYQGSLKPALVNIAAPTITPSVGAELLTDSGLEATYTAGLCDSLTKTGTPTLAQSADVHGGAKAQSFLAGAQDDRLNNPTFVPTVGGWYSVSVWGKRTVGTSSTCLFRLWASSPGVITGQAINDATYTQKLITFRATLAEAHALFLWESGFSFDTVIVDDFSEKPLTLSSLFSGTPKTGSKQGIFGAAPTVVAGTQCGISYNDDGNRDPAGGANPINTMLLIEDRAGGVVKLVKVLAGVYTELISAAYTHVDTQDLRAIRVDDTTNANHACYHNGAQKGTTQPLAHATHGAIKDNVLVDGFSTSASNSTGAIYAHAGIGVA